MLEFFIALFGGLFYGTKYASEKSEINAIRRENESKSNASRVNKEDWMAKVVDKELEMQLEDFIYHSENYNAVWQEVSAAFAEMPWNRDRILMCFSPDDVVRAFGKGVFTKKERENIAKNHRKEALRIMMANRGKLCQFDAEYGICNYDKLAPTVLEAKRQSEQSAQFVMWINDRLKRYNIDEDLFIETLDCHTAFPIESLLFIRGTYKWRPALPHYVEIKP